MREMDKFVDYCARADPEFSRRVIGADEHDILQVETAAGQSLAPEHRAFLTRMGRTPPNCFGEFLRDVEFGVEATLRFYADPPVPAPSDAFYVWTLDIYNEMFLSSAVRDGARPLVLFSWSVDAETGKFTSESRSEHVVANSLLQYFYQEAVLRIRAPSLPHYAQFGARRETQSMDKTEHQEHVTHFKSVAEKLGFQPVPYVDTAPIFYERADAVLLFFPEKLARDSIYLHAQESREFAKLCEVVSDNLEVSRWS
ncbi:hypothetical protein [Myxococcus landrumensis]|uniref:Immunity protein 52 domain-containing protein n=1 Tax=Myxococcus landrumensis TaxID=2813577 RepID=A0ABX7MXH5_9BACT|nr:hypothetical protein [Myxococcus landrumus]QSQ11043.1 hypothetical protein JY572_21720 [Myxococcus landrumus]